MIGNKIGDRVGYVYAKYVRPIQSQAQQEQQVPAPSSGRETPVASEPPGITTAPESHSYESPEYSKVEIFGGYSFVRLDGSAGNMDGWNASIPGNLTPTFGVKGEFSGLYAKDKLNNSVRYSGYSFTGGPQITGRIGSVNAFAHALFGVEHLGGSAPFQDFRVGASINAIAMAFGGG
jgi:hypothetical protein